MKQLTFKYLLILFVPLVAILIFISACTKDVGKIKSNEQLNNYPEAVGNIIINKCAVSGCHNTKSKDAAGGLNFETWDLLFEGGKTGPAVIAYRPDFSTLLYYTNTYQEYGSVQLTPRMPINEDALSKDEIKTLFNWMYVDFLCTLPKHPADNYEWARNQNIRPLPLQNPNKP